MIQPEYFHPKFHPEINERVGRFVSEIIWGEDRSFGPFASMGVFDGERLIAGTIYHNWAPESGVIELTSASTSRRWLARPVIRAIFAMPFEGLKCQMVALRVSPQNHRMLRIARSFGFNEYRIPRLRGRDEDEMIFTYTDDQWRASPFNGG